MSEYSNAVNLRLPLEILMLIREESAKKEQLSATYILFLLTEHYKDKLIAEYGKSFYDELVNRYSRTIKEQKTIKNLKNEEKAKKKQARIEYLKAELSLLETQLSNPKAPQIIRLKNKLKLLGVQNPNDSHFPHKPKKR